MACTSGGSSCPSAISVRTRRDGRQPRLVDVVQPHLVDAALVPVAQQGTVDEGCAEAAAPEHRELHASTTCVPGLAARVESGGVGALVGQQHVDRAGLAHTQGPGARHLVAVDEQHRDLGRVQQGPLDRHLDGGGVQDRAVGAHTARTEEDVAALDLPQRVLGEGADE